MRKFLLVLMALCLAALPCLAEGAAPAETTAPVETIDYDFGDFTLTFPAEMPGEIADEITSGAPFVTLYQMDDLEDAFSSNLNVVWTEDASDLSAADPAATAQSIVDGVVASLAQQGIVATNPTILAATMDEVGGKPALSVIYSMDMDYSGAGVDLQVNVTYIQGIVSEEGLGTYTFTIGTDNINGCQSLIDIVNTTVWAK